MEQFIFSDNYSVEEIEEDINIICNELQMIGKVLCESKYMTEKAKNRYIEVLAAIGAAENALELQVPKKPTDQFGGEMKNGICPNCEGKLNIIGGKVERLFNFMSYCSSCGQRLDWE